jgi:4-diphosphocytidyl-2-C-methyl-D-erythritol kinase
MVSFPPCKINLGLHIIRKRADGYHDLATCFYPVPWTDILEVIPSTTLTFTCSGLPIPGRQEENLCLKAYALLKKEFTLPPVNIHVHKVIPMGAGLGGGSSDAAHTLRLLNEIFQLQLNTFKLSAYASKLGSDCPFFIQDQPMLGTSRGEVLAATPVTLKGKFLVIVKPPIHVSTAAAFARVDPHQPDHGLAKLLEEVSPRLWKNVLINDFEFSVFQQYPRIKEIKDALYRKGATYASMSGSGAAVFGIFESEISLEGLMDENQTWSGFL